MIISNLRIRLAERGYNVTKVSKDTGVSRTTISSLADGQAKGVQLDTINTLCTYLEITPQDLFDFYPADFSFIAENLEQIDYPPYTNSVDINVSILKKLEKEIVHIIALLRLDNDTLYVKIDESDQDYDFNERFFDEYKCMSLALKEVLKNKIALVVAPYYTKITSHKIDNIIVNIRLMNI